MNRVSRLRIPALYGSYVPSAAKSYLDDMRYAANAGCIPEKRCLQGTRRHLLQSITEKLLGAVDTEGEQPKRIVLLTGVAGSGKSAVAHEIAHYFRSLHRLGGSFCFNASRQTELSMDRFLSTISHGLADLDVGWKNALVEVIKPAKDIRTTSSPKMQFDNFIVKPAEKLEFIGPIVVVVDAIDEVADEDRDSLLDCLSRLAEDKDLPNNIRFLVTSRPDGRTVKELQTRNNVDSMDISVEKADDDIGLFVEHQLKKKSAEVEWAEIENDWVPYLTQYAEGLFQWAATACAFITGKSVGLSSKEKFLKLKEERYPGLYRLYGVILNQIVEDAVREDAYVLRGEIILKIRRVLVLIITVREPLPQQGWKDFLDSDKDKLKEFQQVTPYLGSLLRGVSENDSAPIQPLHTSFRDYTTLPNGSHSFTIDSVAVEATLATFSFAMMEHGLKFNICGLETSYRANKDVPDLSGKIHRNISPALAYACRFWTSHLAATPHKQFPLDLLFSFSTLR